LQIGEEGFSSPPLQSPPPLNAQKTDTTHNPLMAYHHDEKIEGTSLAGVFGATQPPYLFSENAQR